MRRRESSLFNGAERGPSGREEWIDKTDVSGIIGLLRGPAWIDRLT